MCPFTRAPSGASVEAAENELHPDDVQLRCVIVDEAAEESLAVETHLSLGKLDVAQKRQVAHPEFAVAFGGQFPLVRAEASR